MLDDHIIGIRACIWLISVGAATLKYVVSMNKLHEIKMVALLTVHH